MIGFLRVLIAVMTVAALSACASLDDGRNHLLPPPTAQDRTPMNVDEALRDVGLARIALTEIHAGYDRYVDADSLDTLWNALERKARDGVTREELYVELSYLLAAIKCDHTKAELPKDIEAFRNTAPIYLPFQFILFDDRMYVDIPDPADNLKRGAEILAIDGIKTKTWLRAIEPLVPVDGDTVQSKADVIARSTEFQGGALDTFAPYLTDIGPMATLRVRTRDGAEEVVVDRVGYEAYQEIIGERRYSINFADSVVVEPVGQDGAYIRVGSFVNYRKPVNAMRKLAPYFEQMKAEGRTKLIVDMRENGGGSDDAQRAFMRHLIDKPILQVEAFWTRFDSLPEEVKPHLGTWNRQLLNPDPAWFEDLGTGYYKVTRRSLGPRQKPIEPAEHAFEGEVAVLTGPRNASGATHMVAQLKASGRGTFIGERTGGAPTGATAGTLYFLTLPESGIIIRIPAIRNVIANAKDLPKRNGIAPDIKAPMTAKAYFAGQDPAMEAAKKHLGITGASRQ